RPWVLMKELGISFEEELVPFGGNERYRTFTQFSPTGRVPCLADGTRVIWDSLAITEYLAEREPRVWPRDADARAWARSAAAEMHSGFQALRERCGMNCGVRVRLDGLGPAVEADLRRIDELWRQGLSRSGGPFLCGPAFTAADAFFAPVAFRVQTYGLPLSPDAAAYAARLLALPSMRAWYAAALAEPWRDPTHEEDVRRAGTLIEDLRAPAADGVRS
ncbi:MAG TPA: glutathione S-transferase N-terminal domain-containing protein, partial [Gemmatimonadaceae bacterium]|nr:glutathione S-transferase N-terminal domain-containing protein [Gemmatimonadaceae bacterium]